MKVLASVLVSLFFAAAAAAQDTVESLSEVRDYEEATMDRTSIEAVGEMARFDVWVKWRDPSKRPPEAAATRAMRFVVRCAEKTFAVAAIATLNAQGKMLKNYVVPPGGADFLPAAEGSPQAGWVEAACSGVTLSR